MEDPDSAVPALLGLASGIPGISNHAEPSSMPSIAFAPLTNINRRRSTCNAADELENAEFRQQSMRRKRLAQHRKQELESAEVFKRGNVKNRYIITLRLIVFFILALVGALGGYYVFTFLNDSEEKLFNQNFNDYVENMKISLPIEFSRTFSAGESAKLYHRQTRLNRTSSSVSNSSFLFDMDFDEYTKNILKYTGVRACGYNKYISSYEELHVIDTLVQETVEENSEELNSTFGVDVKKLRDQISNGSFYKLKGVNTPYAWRLLNKTPDYFTPVVNTAPIKDNQGAMLYDIASDPSRKIAIDTAINYQVAAATDIVQLVQDGTKTRASGLVVVPLYSSSANKTNAMLPIGFGTTVFSWDVILTNSMSIQADAWIRLSSSRGTVFSFRKTRNGNLTSLGFFENFTTSLPSYLLAKKSSSIVLSGGGDLNFTITVYPSVTLYESYHTTTPRNVMIVFVFVMVAVILLFGSYDYLVQGFSRILKRLTSSRKNNGQTKLAVVFAQRAAEIFGPRDLKSIIFPNEIEHDDIVQLDILGKGAFGSVFKGLLRELDSPTFLVAVKTLTLNISFEDTNEILREALLMNQLRHDRVCHLVGICPASKLTPMMLILQYCEYGSLQDVLRNIDLPPIYNTAKYLMAADVASGLSYIHDEGVVHRDVAARNVLVDSLFRCRISDFGHARCSIQPPFSGTLTHSSNPLNQVQS